VRKASELEQKYNFGRNFDNLNGAVVAANRAASSANAAAGAANVAAEAANRAANSANRAANSANAAAEAARQSIEEVNAKADFMITGTMAADGMSAELDKSFDEILAAARQKRKCTVIMGDDSLNVFELVFANDRQIRFQQLTQDGVLVSLEVSPDGEAEKL